MNIKAILSFFVIIIFSVSCHVFSPGKIADKKTGCIVIYGDSQSNHQVHKQVVDAILKVNPAVVFHAGDLVSYGGSKDQWRIFNSITKELMQKAKFYPAIGNHECNSQLFFDNFELPNNEQWYSVDVGNIHFIVLDTNWHIFQYSEQYEWLENDLKNIKPNIAFRVVVMHHPPFSSGTHPPDEKNLRDSIVPLFEKYKVDMVFSGHDHLYERLYHNNIFYIVTGGGGGDLYEKARDTPQSQVLIRKHHFCALYPDDKQLLVKVFDLGMNVIDRFRKLKK